ncbi:hypothetical protein HDU93_008050 [Gonapodya sp. JEL0774]|nr:hypothetical protein HDU93_008050 [Gonapodya sp. JEL0774]
MHFPPYSSQEMATNFGHIGASVQPGVASGMRGFFAALVGDRLDGIVVLDTFDRLRRHIISRLYELYALSPSALARPDLRLAPALRPMLLDSRPECASELHQIVAILWGIGSGSGAAPLLAAPIGGSAFTASAAKPDTDSIRPLQANLTPAPGDAFHLAVLAALTDLAHLRASFLSAASSVALHLRKTALSDPKVAKRLATTLTVLEQDSDLDIRVDAGRIAGRIGIAKDGTLGPSELDLELETDHLSSRHRQSAVQWSPFDSVSNTGVEDDGNRVVTKSKQYLHSLSQAPVRRRQSAPLPFTSTPALSIASPPLVRPYPLLPPTDTAESNLTFFPASHPNSTQYSPPETLPQSDSPMPDYVPPSDFDDSCSSSDSETSYSTDTSSSLPKSLAVEAMPFGNASPVTVPGPTWRPTSRSSWPAPASAQESVQRAAMAFMRAAWGQGAAGGVGLANGRLYPVGEMEQEDHGSESDCDNTIDAAREGEGGGDVNRGFLDDIAIASSLLHPPPSHMEHSSTYSHRSVMPDPWSSAGNLLQNAADVTGDEASVNSRNISFDVATAAKAASIAVVAGAGMGVKRWCRACGAVNSPEWRTGAGGETLCNACGLRFRRRAAAAGAGGVSGGAGGATTVRGRGRGRGRSVARSGTA